MTKNKNLEACSLALSVLFTFAPISYAEQWDYLTDCRSVNDLINLNDRLWIASNGGLTEFNPHSGDFRTYTPLDGLGGVGVYDLCLDDDGGFWVACNNLVVQKWYPDSGPKYSVFTLKGDESGLQTINEIKKQGERVYLATDRGIAVLAYNSTVDRWVWFEELTRLGSFDANIAVKSLYVDADTIWAATAQGVARGDLSTPLPLSWVNYTTNNGLPGNNVLAITKFDNTLYVSTAVGSAKLNGNRWERIFWRSDIFRFFVNNDTLWATSSDGISHWNGSQWVRRGSLILHSNAATWMDDGSIWLGFRVAGLNSGGVATLVQDTVWSATIVGGPISNLIRTSHFSSDGSVYLAGGKLAGEYGLSRFRDNEWTVWNYPARTESPFRFQHRTMTEDKLGGIWTGSFGGGLTRYGPNDSISFYGAEPATGNRLQGYPGRPNDALTPAIDVDDAGNLWAINRGALNGYILVCVPATFIANPDTSASWIYFHRSNFRSFEEFDLLEIDSRGRKWIASSANNPSISADQGVYILDDRGTIADSTDDRVWGPVAGLLSKEVLSIKRDPAGYIWVGTPRGAFYISENLDSYNSSAFTQVYNLRENPVYSIDVDPAGNKWFGTEFGVFILAPDLFTVIRQITENPPDRLPSQKVQMVSIDPYSGRAYIGTENGTATLMTPYRDYGNEIGKITFEPNPFNPDKELLIFTGTSLAGGAKARFFTPDGRLVRSLDHNSAALGWDGRDDAGNPVADGVYLILTYDGSGQAGQGKVAVLRR